MTNFEKNLWIIFCKAHFFFNGYLSFHEILTSTFSVMDFYELCNRPPFYPKPRSDFNMMLGELSHENEVTGTVHDHLHRKFKEKGEMHFGKKIWYLGETIRKVLSFTPHLRS